MSDVKYARSPEELASARQTKGMSSFGGKGSARIARRALLGASAGVVVATVVLLISNPYGFSADQFEPSAFFIVSGFFAYLGALFTVIPLRLGAQRSQSDIHRHDTTEDICSTRGWGGFAYHGFNETNVHYDHQRRADESRYHNF